MRKASAAAILSVTILMGAHVSFADKIKAETTLKDSRPTGTKDKEHKHQGYDLAFNAEGKAYLCRTDPRHSMNAIDFVVGAPMHVEIDKNKAKIKTPENKKVDCEIVRVEVAAPPL
jgi:hypothetical protein